MTQRFKNLILSTVIALSGAVPATCAPQGIAPAIATTATVAASVAVSTLSSDVALAGYTLDATNDRIEIGTMGSFGSSLKQSAGWSMSCNLKTSQTSVACIMASFTTGAQGAPGAGNQSIWWCLAGYTSDIANNANHGLINFGDYSDTGILWHQEFTGIDVNDNVRHNHTITVTAVTGAGATMIWYVDGTAFNTWTKPFSDTLGTISNFTNTLAIGPERKNGGTWFNWTDGTFDDCRLYLRALTAQEVSDVVKLRGRDSVPSLHRRWPLQGACVETMKGDTCNPVNGPVLTTVNELDGVRRR